MIKPGKIPLILVLSLCLLSPLVAMGNREKEEVLTTFTGKVAVKGSEPHTWLALVTGQGDIKLSGPLAEEMRRGDQGRTLTIKGRKVADGTGPGHPPEWEVVQIIRTN